MTDKSVEASHRKLLSVKIKKYLELQSQVNDLQSDMNDCKADIVDLMISLGIDKYEGKKYKSTIGKDSETLRFNKSLVSQYYPEVVEDSRVYSTSVRRGSVRISYSKKDQK